MFDKAVTVDPMEFAPRPSNWFATTLEYVGRCKAEFSSPRGSVEGPAKVSVNEAGYVSVEMVPEPDTLLTGSPSRYGLVGFIGGEDFEQERGAGFTRLDPFSENPCTRLEVETPHGTFRTDDVPHYGREADLYHGEVRKVTFVVGQSAFDADGAGDPEYWVLPLANFLSECRDWRDELDRHPLRIFPTPEVPNEVTHVPFGPDHDALMKRAWSCLSTAYSKNHLIVFEFAEGPGFVERLPDYEETKELLLEGKERRKTTAVMVGSTGSGPVESFERMRNWFPFDVLSLLTLATGTEVGCPWVEIRDGEGRLVRRFHRYLGVRPFRKGRRLIEEIPLRNVGLRATGRLVERACSRSQHFGQTFVRAAIVHLVRAGYEDQSLDDRISHLARGFETLCKQYRTTREHLGRSLSTAQREEAERFLRDAARQIRNLRTAGGPAQSGALDRIADRGQGAAQTDNAFGFATAKLLKSFWLADAHILESHYRNRKGGWAGLLTHYRGDVTHHGYLDILEAGHDVQEIADVTFHLHDALARVLLKILKFDGGYSPGVIPYTGAVRVDWVKPHFPARALGYGRT